MKILYWNARGVANHETRLVLEEFCNSQKLDILFIAEPWMAFENFPSPFWKKLRIKPFGFNERSHALLNLWGLCAENLCDTLDPNIRLIIFLSGI